MDMDCDTFYARFPRFCERGPIEAGLLVAHPVVKHRFRASCERGPIEAFRYAHGPHRCCEFPRFCERGPIEAELATLPSCEVSGFRASCERGPIEAPYRLSIARAFPTPLLFPRFM